MKDDKQKLIDLRDKVKDGAATYSDFHSLCQVFKGYHGRAHEAYEEGSIDGAKAVHGALFSGWTYVYSSLDGHFILGHPTDSKVYEETHDKCQARAWIITMLDALISEAGE